MKQRLLLLFAVLAMAVSASAYDFAENDAGVTIYYNILEGGTSVEVTSGDSKYSGSVTIPSSVTDEGKNYTVTSIGKSAFDGCSGLTSVAIPNSVTTIGNFAFYNTGLTTVEIPTSVTSIGTQAFTHCSSLSSFTGKFASDDHRCLIDNKTLIAFAPAGLTSYKIPDCITSIGKSAFYSFDKLTWVTIPNSVKTIETSAFANCYGLTSMVIPSSVTEIGENAFHYCKNLTEIISLNTTVPATSSNPFDQVPTSCKVIVPNTTAVTSYEGNEHWNKLTITSEQVIYYTATSKVEPADEAFTVTDKQTTNIKSNEYNNETGKWEITFNGIVTAIGCYEIYEGWGEYKGAFQSCTNLTSITIPNSVTSIGDYAFSGCI